MRNTGPGLPLLASLLTLSSLELELCSSMILGKVEIEFPMLQWSSGPGGWKAARMVGDIKVFGKAEV